MVNRCNYDCQKKQFLFRNLTLFLIFYCKISSNNFEKWIYFFRTYCFGVLLNFILRLYVKPGLGNALSNTAENFNDNVHFCINGILMAYVQATEKTGENKVELESVYMESGKQVIKIGS